jgi:hypothetical protein
MYYVGGDSIGADSSATDNRGGFTAIRQSDQNLGQPAILVSLEGRELLTELRVIVFGIPAGSGNLLFNNFDYRLDVWRSHEYFLGNEPQFQIQLGQPSNATLIGSGPTFVIPDEPFGVAGAGGGNATTYDFRFDLSNCSMAGPPSGAACVFNSSLAVGEWVFGFQSWHDASVNGFLRVSAAVSEEGPLPLFSRDNVVPRGILGGQDPNDVVLYWGMSLAAVTADIPSLLGGDFNRNGIVDAADYTVWRDNFGATDESSLNGNGDGIDGVESSDYELWKANFGLSTIRPDYLGGDFNRNGVVDAADYTVWRDNLGAPSEMSLNGNGDGLNGVDAGDYSLWKRNFGARTFLSSDLDGDFNGNGVVDAADYTVWRDNLGATSESTLNNNGDGANGVDVGDYLLWKQNFGAVRTFAQNIGASVAEPSSALLLLIASSCVVRRRVRSTESR